MNASNKQKILSALAEVDALRRIITDEQVIESGVSNVFKDWDGNGKSYIKDDKLIYNNTRYRVMQNHTSQPHYPPGVAVSLYVEILPGQDGTAIGVWQRPGANNGYSFGAKVYYPDENGHIYSSLYDNNVWEPVVSNTWELVS